MTTYRNENLTNGDTTHWLYDEPSGCMTNKLYADGKGPSYSYTPDGKLARRTWARGIVTDYTYDNAGNLTRTEYSDTTPTITMSYDRVGNLVNATTAGVVTNLYAYNLVGHCTNEWQNDFNLTRYYDALGRSTGYAINGERQTTIAYDTYGRISTMTTATGGAGVPPAQGGSGLPTASNGGEFRWTYLPNSDLKSSLTYPNGLTASWQYDANNQLLRVRNATPTNIISQFDYTYDAAGRRVSIAKTGSAFGDLSGSVDSYTYNARSELTSARRTKNGQPIPGFSEDFDYDPIGNRRSSATYNEKGEAQTSTYEANNLNQYTTRTTPGYAAVRGEADPNAFVSINGNEAYRLGSYYFGSDLFDNTAAGGLANLETYATLAQTAANGDETEDLVSSVTNQVYLAQSPEAFAYDDDGNQTLITTKTGLWRVTYNGENRSILWVRDSDNTTLAMAYDHMGRRRVKNGQRFFYDGYQQIANFHSPTPTQNSNYYIWDCTEFVATRPLAWLCGNTLACYVYDGNKNVSEVFSSDSEIVAHYDYAPFGAVTTQRGESTATNPWRFSCEYADDELGCDYYNYRHYEPVMGRWMSRDPIGEEGGLGLYGFYRNSAVIGFDVLGMKWKIMRKGGDFAYACAPTKSDTFSSLAKLLKLDRKDLDKWAHTSDAEAVLGKFYKIPNLIVFQVGQLLVYPDKVSYSIFGVWESANAMLADVYASAGYQVRVENVTEASSVVSALGTDGLYKYYFTGHGGKDACLIIDADYKFWEESEQVVIPGRYTKYGISEMVLQACYSAETPWVTGWLGNVARAGKFTGYAGSVNSSNRQELTKSFGGSGR